jgi:hypothetical protein
MCMCMCVFQRAGTVRVMAIDNRQLRHTSKHLAGIVWQPRHVTLDQIKPPQRGQLGLVPCDVDRERERDSERENTHVWA